MRIKLNPLWSVFILVAISAVLGIVQAQQKAATTIPLPPEVVRDLGDISQARGILQLQFQNLALQEQLILERAGRSVGCEACQLSPDRTAFIKPEPKPKPEKDAEKGGKP